MTIAADETDEVSLKNLLKQLHLVENFQGDVITRVYLADEVLTYQTGILKEKSRANVSTMHTFWQLKGKDIGRKIRTIPWFYLPPDFSLVQYALPIERSSNISEPLRKIGENYEIKLVEKTDNQLTFELTNGYLKQKVLVDPLRNIILEIQILNALGNVINKIDYVNWKEYYSGIRLPEAIRVFDDAGQLLMEIAYSNWKFNQGVERFAQTIPTEWNQAVEDLKAKIMNNPGNDRYHFELAQIYKDRQFWSNALEELDKALALNPKLEYRQELVVCYQALGQYQEAINQLYLILEKNESGEIYYLLGNLYSQINNPMLARDAYEQAVALESNNYLYWERLFWNYRNISLEDQKMVKKASQAGEKLVELVPDKYIYRIYLGDLYLEMNKSEEALKQFLAAEKLTDDNSFVLVKIASYHEKMGQLKEAEIALQDAIKVEEHWWNYLQLGDFYLRQVQIEKALLAYESSLQMNPRNTDLNIKLGKVLWQLGQEAEAKRYWYLALQYEESNIYTYIKVGEIFLEYNLTDEAEEIFNKAIQRFNILEDQSTASGLSRVYEEIGLLYLAADPNYSISLFEKAYAHQPRSISGQYIGLKELKQGNLEQAINYWTEANLLDGDNYRTYIYLTTVRGLRGEILGTQNKEFGLINQYLTVEERELISKFFGYFNIIRAVKNEDENAPKEAKLAYTAGMNAFLAGDLLDAVTSLERAIEGDKQYRQGHFFLGIILALLDRVGEAEEHFQVIQKYYAGSSTARVAADIGQSIDRLFWKTKII